MKKLSILSALVAVVFAVPSFSFAETVLRVSDSVTVAVDQKVDGDFYGLSTEGPVSLSGTIDGDAYVVGGSVTTNGRISSDLFAIGGVVQVHASVTDDIRIVGGEVTIAENVGGDVFVIGGVLTVLSSARIDGNVFFYGGKGELNGQVKGSVYGVVDSLRVDGSVGKDIDVQIGSKFVLGDRANVSGDVSYESFMEVVRAQNAVVVGDIVRNSPRTSTANPRGVLVPFLVYAFTVLVMYALLRNRLDTFVTKSMGQFTKNGLIGICAILLLPFAVLLTFATLIGAILGFMGLLMLLLLYVASIVFSAVLVGVLVEQIVTKQKQVTLLWTVVGIFVYSVLLLIPFVGPLIALMLMSVVMGSLLHTLYQKLF